MIFRIKKKADIKSGERKYVYKFLFFPVCIGNEVRWMEFAHIMYEYKIHETYTYDEILNQAIPVSFYDWVPVKFIMNDPVKECQIYVKHGCSHVDGPLCTPRLCKEYFNVK